MVSGGSVVVVLSCVVRKLYFVVAAFVVFIIVVARHSTTTCPFDPRVAINGVTINATILLLIHSNATCAQSHLVCNAQNTVDQSPSYHLL